MSVEAYNGKVDAYLSNYIACKVDSLNDIFLDFFSQETLEKLLQSSTNHPVIFSFRTKENGEIHSVTFGIKKDVDEALNSEEFYRVQNLMKCSVVFKAPSSLGLIGCVRFSFPVKKEQIQAKLFGLEDHV